MKISILLSLSIGYSLTTSVCNSNVSLTGSIFNTSRINDFRNRIPQPCIPSGFSRSVKNGTWSLHGSVSLIHQKCCRLIISYEMVCFYSLYEFAIVNLYMFPFLILWRFPFVSLFIYKTISFYLSYHKKHGSHRLYPRHPPTFFTPNHTLFMKCKKSRFLFAFQCINFIFLDCACLFSKRNTDITSNIAKTQH